MPTIALSDLTVRRGPTTVVQGLTLSVTDGTPFWVVGPNGAGKTSLLRVVAGLDTPAAGSLVRGARPGAPFLYFHSEMALPGWSMVDAWERLIRGLRPGAAPPTRLRPDLPRGRWIRRLSTGERKRLLLDALFRIPGSLLLDEPYEHLSPDAKATLSELLRRRARTDIVLVVTNQATHRAPTEAGIRLEAGRVERLGSGSGDPGGAPPGAEPGPGRAPRAGPGSGR